MLTLCLYPTDKSLDEITLNTFGEEDADHILFMKYPSAINCSLAARKALLTLCEDRSLPPPTILRGELERPYFFGQPNSDISLSHTEGLALAALDLGDCPRVGVDIERHDPQRDVIKTANRFFPPEEAKLCSADRGEFFRLWTQKEAIAKYFGERLLTILPQNTERMAKERGLILTNLRLEYRSETYDVSICHKAPFSPEMLLNGNEFSYEILKK